MSYLKTFFRLLLGLFMTYAGFSHLTFNRQEFVAQVPTWLQFSEGFTLNTDNLRLIRLFIQPVLIYLALWSTGGWQQLKSWWQCLTKSKKA